MQIYNIQEYARNMKENLVIAKIRVDPISDEEHEHFSIDFWMFWMVSTWSRTLRRISMLTTVFSLPRENKNIFNITTFYQL